MRELICAQDHSRRCAIVFFSLDIFFILKTTPRNLESVSRHGREGPSLISTA